MPFVCFLQVEFCHAVFWVFWCWLSWRCKEKLCSSWPHVGCVVVRINPLRFMAGCCKRRQKPALSVLYLSTSFIVLLFIKPMFYVSLIFVGMCSIFWLFWLSCQYLSSNWLERLLWCSLSESTKPRPKSVDDFYRTTLCIIIKFLRLLNRHMVHKTVVWYFALERF